MTTKPEDILITIRSKARIYCVFNTLMLIASPMVFRGWERKWISLKNAYRHVLIMVMIFIDIEVDDGLLSPSLKSHVNIMAIKDAHIRVYKIIARIVRLFVFIML